MASPTQSVFVDDGDLSTINSELSQLDSAQFSRPREAEQGFSGTRRQISWDRAKLGGQQIEKMECLKHWWTKKVLARRITEVPDVIVDGLATT
jgi:hypothetical protein